MEKFGITTPEEVQPDTLADRLERDTCAADAQVTYVPTTAAWTTVG